MDPLSAIALTLVILLATTMLSVWIHFPVLLVVAPLTAAWAVWDVVRLRRRFLADPDFAPNPDAMATLLTSRPTVVIYLCFGLWPFGFPWHLVIRRRLLAGGRAQNKHPQDPKAP